MILWQTDALRCDLAKQQVHYIFTFLLSPPPLFFFFFFFNSQSAAGFTMSSISRPITEFCLDLYDKFNKTAEGQNILFSPTSISVALALIHLGTRNNTAAQIEKVSTNETL